MGISISTMEGKARSEERPWAALPHDVLFLIFQKLGTIEILLAAQAVCTSWQQLARNPHLWCCIDMRLNPNKLNDCVMEKLTFEAIDRSNGYIEEFYAGGFIWDDTFTYIANRTTGLRKFALTRPRGFTKKALLEFICKCPLLEELEITDHLVSKEAYEKIEHACPKLKRFQCPIKETWNSDFDKSNYYNDGFMSCSSRDSYYYYDDGFMSCSSRYSYYYDDSDDDNARYMDDSDDDKFFLRGYHEVHSYHYSINSDD